jgi:hypothetical protein
MAPSRAIGRERYLKTRAVSRLVLPYVLAAMGVVLATTPGCASNGGGAGNETPYEGDRSPFKSTLMAIFPGFFVHGLGNYYAGKTARSEELMGEEGIGLGCMAIGAGLGALGYYEHLQADKEKGTTMVLDRIGEVGSWVGCAGFLGFGIVSFFDSWIRDIYEAGDAARERNRERREQYDRYYQQTPADPTVGSTADVTTAGAPARAVRLSGKP